jgi:hypothetical protein
MGRRLGIVSPSAMMVLVVAAGLAGSCGGGPRESGGEAGGGRGRKESAPDSLEATVKLNEGGYAIGEPIVMTLEVTNKTDRTLELTYPSAQRYDFVVMKGKESIWRWSGGKMFAQVIARYQLARGDTIAYEYTWDQTRADGTKPGLGAYTVEGMLMVSPPLKTGTRTFGIVD